jgi:hypothetical protein
MHLPDSGKRNMRTVIFTIYPPLNRPSAARDSSSHPAKVYFLPSFSSTIDITINSTHRSSFPFAIYSLTRIISKAFWGRGVRFQVFVLLHYRVCGGGYTISGKIEYCDVPVIAKPVSKGSVFIRKRGNHTWELLAVT